MMLDKRFVFVYDDAILGTSNWSVEEEKNILISGNDIHLRVIHNKKAQMVITLCTQNKI